MKSVIIIGAGDRGSVYASYAEKNPGRVKVAAVADPVPERRDRIADRHGIPGPRRYASWEEALSLPRFADGCIVATQDALHVAPAMAAMDRGYNVLLEKPMALAEQECEALAAASCASGASLIVCHVLRHTDFFRTVRHIIDRGDLGQVISILHAENVSYYHMAHSYVRGSWRNSGGSSPMILAKCCHDLDLVAWFAGSAPVRVASFGGLAHFTAANAPAGAPVRCTDGCPESSVCPYEAVSTYLRGRHMKLAVANSGSRGMAMLARFMLRSPSLAGRLPFLSRFRTWREWPTATITDDMTEQGIMRALGTGPYGRCVYRCDNDQPDHQETIIEFANGCTGALRMHGHGHREGRTLRIDGSLATLRGDLGSGRLEVHRHGSGGKKTYPLRGDLLGHREGDFGLMEDFVKVLEGRPGLTTAEESLASHRLAFAADRSRRERRVVYLREEYGGPCRPGERRDEIFPV
jgi:predicted dehydrogenase